MQLEDYLEQNSISKKDFAASARLSLVTIYKYLSGKRKPTSKEIMQRISKATGGAVTANDFYGIEPLNGSTQRKRKTQ